MRRLQASIKDRTYTTSLHSVPFELILLNLYYMIHPMVVVPKAPFLFVTRWPNSQILILPCRRLRQGQHNYHKSIWLNSGRVYLVDGPRANFDH